MGNKYNNPLSNHEIFQIKRLYTEGFRSGDGSLDNLSKELGRHKTTICSWAKKLGFTSYKRKKTVELRKEMNEKSAIAIKSRIHPRGNLGKKHSDESRKKMSIGQSERYKKETLDQKSSRVRKSFQTKIKRYGTISPINPNVTWKQGWRVIGDRRIYFRSAWESNYGRYLELLKNRGLIEDWEHEPKTFWFEGIKRGCVTYLPDFKVMEYNGTHHWVEVKGWMDARSKTKIARFKKYFPEEKLIVIEKKWFQKEGRNISILIPEWEHGRF